MVDSCLQFQFLESARHHYKFERNSLGYKVKPHHKVNKVWLYHKKLSFCFDLAHYAFKVA